MGRLDILEEKGKGGKGACNWPLRLLISLHLLICYYGASPYREPNLGKLARALWCVG